MQEITHNVSSTVSDPREKELEDFLLDIDCLDKLDKWANRLNIFDILSVSGTEIRHSNFLAWLLDPHELHSLNDYFIRKILQKASKTYGPERTPIKIVDIDSLTLDDLVVYREFLNIDVMAVSDSSKLALVIENKIHSTEHDEQLLRYREDMIKRFPDYRKVFVYLTLNGENPSDDEWIPMSYEYIYDLVNSILSNKDLTDRCRIYLEDYSNALAGELMNDEELRQTCINIYNNHKKAIDLIIENLPDRQFIIYERLLKILSQYESEGKIIMLSSTRSYLRFTTPRIRAKAGQVGYDSWVSDKDLLVFEIENTKSSNKYMSLIIGPGDSRYREPWYEYLKTTTIYKTKTKKLNEKWCGIQILRIPNQEYTDEEYIDVYIKSVKKYLDNLEHIEDIIESGPDLL